MAYCSADGPHLSPAADVGNRDDGSSTAVTAPRRCVSTRLRGRPRGGRAIRSAPPEPNAPLVGRRCGRGTGGVDGHPGCVRWTIGPPAVDRDRRAQAALPAGLLPGLGAAVLGMVLAR